MCGIAGFCNFDGDRKKNMEQMQDISVPSMQLKIIY